MLTHFIIFSFRPMPWRQGKDMPLASPILPATLSMGAVALRSRDVNRLASFYQSVLGLQLHGRTPSAISLGAGDGALVELLNDPQATPSDRRTPGLFHLALRVPDREALAERVLAADQAGLRIGASDHLVSEAIYLDDPDGNGIEVYCDRERSTWPWTDGRIAMETLPLDLKALASIAPPTPGPLPAGSDIGHVHLKVRDLEEAAAFWISLVGFDLMASYPGALFIAAGGYHHHLGLNVWSSRGAALPSPHRVGLDHLTIRLPIAEIDALAGRLLLSGTPHHYKDGGLRTADPSGNAVRFQAT
ncbi:MAG: VOC family protein [Pseudomonadota bacterium]